ncbi:UNVERIFIED_CONTAM: hypothetical protein Scaly_2846300 [Sesamum calycinum]|uniref:Uncharacterized protein n=1 Tax=Sesamum calycinum TaxID=2727403 RepID=A0AAW2IQ68_9LAMI
MKCVVYYLDQWDKVSVRERHSSGSRRGNYNHDRNDSFSDREGNWNANSKSRAAARSPQPQPTDKSNSRMDRFTHSESRSDRSWNSYRHDSLPSFRSQNGQLHSNSSQNGPQSVAYSMYPLAAQNHNGVSNGPSVPPVMMLYPFDHNATYGSRNEQLEFGHLRNIDFMGALGTVLHQINPLPLIIRGGFDNHSCSGVLENNQLKEDDILLSKFVD